MNDNSCLTVSVKTNVTTSIDLLLPLISFSYNIDDTKGDHFGSGIIIPNVFFNKCMLFGLFPKGNAFKVSLNVLNASKTNILPLQHIAVVSLSHFFPLK